MNNQIEEIKRMTETLKEGIARVAAERSDLEQVNHQLRTHNESLMRELNSRNRTPRISFIIGLHDEDGDCMEDGIFLDFGGSTIIYAGKNTKDIRNLIASLENIEEEIAINFPELRSKGEF